MVAQGMLIFGGMNIFRLGGDFLHVLSFVLLLRKMMKGKNCEGISLRSQELYALVFSARYVDLLWNWRVPYNVVLKITFLTLTWAIVLVMRYNKRLAHTYDKTNDRFRHIYLVGISVVLGIIFCQKSYTIYNFLYTFSLWLEAVAIFPQLYMLERSKIADVLTANFIFCLGGYRALYLIGWLYRWLSEPRYRAWVIWITGLIQTALYSDFFWIWFKESKGVGGLSLPS